MDPGRHYEAISQLLAELLDCGELLADSWPQVLARRAAARIDACRDERELKKVLRRVRQREMLRIAWRDLAGWTSLPETLEDLSELADACIEAALSKLAWHMMQFTLLARTP